MMERSNGMNEPIVFSHYSVLLNECIEALAIRNNGVYVDGTAGGAGHSSAIAAKLGDEGKLLALDQDETAVRVATERLSVFGNRAEVVHTNFCDLATACEERGIKHIDGLLLDLGVSSYQLDTAERGFSYRADAPLDMRMDASKPLTAKQIVNEYSEEALRRILFEYGEERFSSRIASNIIRTRETAEIKTTGELVEIIKRSVPVRHGDGGHHPAMRTFQALRIEVNAELDVIAPAIKSAVSLLNPGGRIAIITFHSLEDRIVKQTFAELANGCTCPKSLPVCVCGNRPKVKILTKKPILPSDEELAQNSRSHSAKLRVVEKL